MDNDEQAAVIAALDALASGQGASGMNEKEEREPCSLSQYQLSQLYQVLSNVAGSRLSLPAETRLCR